MTKEEKMLLKVQLKQWGAFTKNINIYRTELNQINRLFLDMENNSCANECKVTSIDRIKHRASVLNSQLNSQIACQERLSSVINELPYAMQAVLRCRYIKCLTWDLIPLNLPFEISERQCYRLHESAMEVIFKTISKDTISSSNNTLSC